GHRPGRGPDRAPYGGAGARRLRAADRGRPEPEGHDAACGHARARARERVDLDPHRPGLDRLRGVRVQLRGRGHVPAAGAPAQGQAARHVLLPTAGARNPRPPDLPHAGARLSVPHHGPRPRGAMGADGLGQRLHVRPAGVPLVRGLADLRGDARGSGGGRLARPARRILRDLRLRHAGAHPRSRAVPARSARLLMPLFVAGLSYRNAPLELRERLGIEEDKLREGPSDLQATSVVPEVVVLSTCNRVEVYGVAEAPGEARALVFRHLCRQRGVELVLVEDALYTHLESDAVRHAFRVAASLDSMMIGEPQILGQVKDPFALAQACETVGPQLHTLFSQAFSVAKRVRTETEIARHAVSVSFAAVELAKKIFAGLSGGAVLLVGAGKMSELAAKHLVEQGAFPIYVANRTWSRAQDLARS